MDYIRKELSEDDIDILVKIYQSLEKIHIPTCYRSGSKSGDYHGMKTGTVSQRDARQTSFGVTKYRGNLQSTRSSKSYPHILPLFENFIDSHKPGFKFKNVYVNRNTVCKKHLDSKNSGTSLLVGLGSYTGGETVLYDKDGVESKFNINTHSLVFDGSKIEHSSEPFEGTRYSLVFFN